MSETVEGSAGVVAAAEPEVPLEGGAEPGVPVVDARPWHGAENPLEALYQWVRGELAALKG